MTDVGTRISAAQVSLILQRAAEIDAKGDSLTADELHRIAAEAGIDPRATSKAIREILAEEEPGTEVASPKTPGVPAKRSTIPSLGRIMAGGAVGTVLGFLASLAASHDGDVLAIAWLGFGGSVLYLLARALRCMRRKTQLTFQLENFALWFGAAVGGWAMDIFWAEDVLGIALVAWFLSAVVGGLLVRFGPGEEEEEEE